MNPRHVLASAVVGGLAALSTGTAAHGGLTVFELNDPVIFINSTGSTTYDASSDLFTVTGVPKNWDLFGVGTPMADAEGVLSGTFELRAHVDETGTFVSGVDGHDMVMTGSVDVDGDSVIDYSGTLLTGEVTAVGWLNGPSSGLIDFFDQRVTITGGLLASFYAQGAAFSYASENSTFDGDFTVDFSGGAKGNFGAIPAPGALVPFALLGLAGRSRRRR